MSDTLPKTVDGLMRLIYQNGWRVEHTTRGSRRIYSDRDEYVATLKAHSGDPRGLLNFRAALRRGGLTSNPPASKCKATLAEVSGTDLTNIKTETTDGNTTLTGVTTMQQAERFSDHWRARNQQAHAVTQTPTAAPTTDTSKAEPERLGKGVLRDQVLEALRLLRDSHPDGATVNDVADIIGDSKDRSFTNRVNAALATYTSQGLIERVSMGVYRIAAQAPTQAPQKIDEPPQAPPPPDDSAGDACADDIFALISQARQVLGKIEDAARAQARKQRELSKVMEALRKVLP